MLFSETAGVWGITTYLEKGPILRRIREKELPRTGRTGSSFFFMTPVRKIPISHGQPGDLLRSRWKASEYYPPQRYQRLCHK